MNWGVWIWSHLSFMLLIGQAWGLLARRYSLPPKGIMAGLILIAAIGLFPLAGSDLAGLLLGITNHLSIASLMYLLLGLLPAFDIRRDSGHLESLLACLIWIIGGLWLYPASLGIGPEGDPYLPGYGTLMAWLVLALGLSLWILHQRFIALAMVLSVLAWHLHLLDSSNLWDYLIDPWLALFSAIWLVSRLFRRRPATAIE